MHHRAGESLSLFTSTFNRGLSIEARPERLTGDAGAVLLREILERSGIVAWMAERLTDPRDPNLVRYPIADLLRTVLVLFGQGWRDQDDADALRFDPALRLAVTGERGTTPLDAGRHLASQPTLSRLLDILSAEANRRVPREATAEMAGRRLRAGRGGHRRRYLTLDVDSLPVAVHGAQPGTAWNGHYQQRMYHPLIACVAETGDLLDARLRPGNAHTAEGALGFILDLVDRVEDRLCQVALVRVDAGFPEEGLLAGLEGRGTPYVARLRSNRVLDRLAAPHLRRPPGRPPAEPRVWMHEMACRAEPWSRERRVVLVVLERPDELLLDHFWLLTSLDARAVPATALLDLYRERGTAEGHLGELMDVLAPALSSAPRTKHHYRGRRLPTLPTGMDAFARNEALLLLHLLAYETLHTGRCLMEGTTATTGWSLRRFRERVLRIGARILLHARRAVLVIGEGAAHHWTLLWARLDRLAWDTT
jgi:Transposase DDE domain group 1